MARKDARKDENTNTDAPKTRKARKSKAGPTPAPEDFLRESPTGKIRFVPGRDATLAAVCRRIAIGEPRDGDAAILAHAPLVQSHCVTESRFLAPLVAAAQDALRGE